MYTSFLPARQELKPPPAEDDHETGCFIPLGIALVIKLIPAEVMQDCREKAALTMKAGRPKNWVAGGIIILIWVSLFAFTFYYLIGIVGNF